ncbi:MAG: caspase family protein [Ignavibacteria bacterium]|nr:caspase family protein [Ignavibacteria bacterium]MCC7158953.1 caspase family protein [Ignavibacteria bacterium]
MKKFLILIFIIPLFINCSKITELTGKGSSEKNDKKQVKTEVTSDIAPGENTYGVIAGVLEWTDKGFPPFSNRNRKDKELYELLRTNGVQEKNLTLLIDEASTVEAMKQAVSDALKKAPEGSTFIFYYAGHGVKDKDNSIYFASYDISSKNYKKSGFNVSWLGDAIRDNFKGKLVWLLADCCYSGAMLDEAEKINAAGKNVIVLTSAASCNISTANWTFTQTVIDCLSGLELADRNNDGTISINETGIELGDAMKYRERQMCGFRLLGIDETAPLAKTSGSVTASSGDLAPGSYYMAPKGSDMAAVRILSTNENNVECEFYDYSDKSTQTFNRSELRPIHFVSYSNGDKIKVSWEGKWYDAEIKKSQNDFYYIKYDGYEDYWNEWVAYDRIKTGKEKSVQVEWNGSWYPAEVLDETGGKYFIRYVNDGYTWDEWVGKERIRF